MHSIIEVEPRLGECPLISGPMGAHHSNSVLATGVAWIVLKTYLERVGEDGIKRHPVGLGPYRFERFDPGVELMLEANERYWRKTPPVKRIIFKGVPERPTRLAMLKTGEADIAYLMIGDESTAVKGDPELRLALVIPPAVWYLEFP
jgi:peptide/nickel transport system substrate-binding protein